MNDLKERITWLVGLPVYPEGAVTPKENGVLELVQYKMRIRDDYQLVSCHKSVLPGKLGAE